jgi:hypothetical protein
VREKISIKWMHRDTKKNKEDPCLHRVLFAYISLKRWDKVIPTIAEPIVISPKPATASKFKHTTLNEALKKVIHWVAQ